MQVVTFANNKGGVGKTACTVLVGLEFARLGWKVLVVDLDPQASATAALVRNPARLTVLDWLPLSFTPQCPAALRHSRRLDVLPCDPEFKTRRIVDRFERLPSPTWSPCNVSVRVWMEDQGYDYVFVDTPAYLDMQTNLGLALADAVVVPVQATTFATAGYETVRAHIQKCSFEAPVLGIVLTKYRSRLVKHQVVLEDLRAAHGRLLFGTTVRESTRLDEILQRGTLYNRFLTSKAGEDIRQLSAEIRGRLDEPTI